MQQLNTTSAAFKAFQGKCMAKSIQARIAKAREAQDETTRALRELIETTRAVNNKLKQQGA